MSYSSGPGRPAPSKAAGPSHPCAGHSRAAPGRVLCPSPIGPPGGQAEQPGAESSCPEQPQVWRLGAKAPGSQRMFTRTHLGDPDGGLTTAICGKPGRSGENERPRATVSARPSGRCCRRGPLSQGPGEGDNIGEHHPPGTWDTSAGIVRAKPSPGVFAAHAPPIIKGSRLRSLPAIYASTKVAHKKHICMSSPLDLISSERLLRSRVRLLCLLEPLTISRTAPRPWAGHGGIPWRLFPKFYVDVSVYGEDTLVSRGSRTQNTSEDRR